MESWRVAQIVVDRGPGIDSARGSGYLVAPGLVLSAAHVLAGALLVRVRLDVGQPTEVDVQAARWWADTDGHNGTDLAVIVIPVEVTAGRDIDFARFGRISDSTAVLAVQTLGFPRFKLRSSAVSTGEPEVFRDLDQVTGHAPVAANRRQGTLAVYLDDPPPSALEGAGLSPWEGMSGAVVWTNGRIIGVVAEHHLSEGTGRLTARRIDRAYEQLPKSDLDQLVTWLGLSPAARQLPDVVSAGSIQLVQSVYLEQVRDIAPDALIGRDVELAEWAEFCAGPETYAWWQAGPWSGKSALASWFVTHPPAGVDIVSFFITGRLAGQADSDAFLDAMIEQLNALDPVGGQPPPVAGARVGVWLSLLTGSATRTEELGRRLVVVVDGLDEDEAGANPPRGRPSIASLLPRRPPRGARFIITSRPDPGLPDDVPSGHPLRSCIPRHLTVSWVAEDVKRRAKQELRDLLTGDQIAIDVVGYVAGSGGGLTASDLSALSGAPPHKLDSILRGVFGRSLETRLPAYFRDGEAEPVTRVYLFAHETLRAAAEEQLGNEVARYRQGVHDWICSYTSRGWPDSTPGYAVRGYPRLLTATSDVIRLSTLARDPNRHAFLLRATGSDYAALTEISDVQRLITAQDAPDLQVLVELAVYRHAISIRNKSIPVGLPAVWAQLARFAHAEALARAITDPRAQVQALTQLAAVLAQAGDSNRASRLAADAEAVARGISDSDAQARALADLVAVVAQAGDPDRAEALARGIADSDAQARALADLVAAVAQAGDPDRAEALARGIADSDAQARALADLVAAMAQAGDPDRAEALARAITDPWNGARALAALAVAVAGAGDPDRAEALARSITYPWNRVRALGQLAAAAAQAGDLDRAEALARAIADSDAQARALADLAAVIARAGDLDRASRLAGDAEFLARIITDSDAQVRALAALAAAAARAGDADRASRLVARAEALARGIADSDAQVRALADLAATAAQAGDADRASRLVARAEALAHGIADSDAQARALAAMADAAARTGDLDRAEALIRVTTDLDAQTQTLTALASAAVLAGDLDRASRLAGDAEALARAITDSDAQARALTALAAAAAQAGDPDRTFLLARDAEALARTITDPRDQMQALADLAAAAAQAGDLDRAEALARAITDSDIQTQTLTQLAAAAAQAGDLDRAEALARAITDSDIQTQTLTQLAAAAAQAGDLDRAEALARAITDSDIQTQTLTQLAAAAAQAGDLDRAEALARTITDSDIQTQTLTQLAAAAAQAGDLDRAEALARTITDLAAEARALTQLAAAAAWAGDLDRAEALAGAITRRRDKARALTQVAAAAARAGDLDRAEALARTITDLAAQARALTQLAVAAARAGDLDRAEALAGAITRRRDKARALTQLVVAATQAGDADRAFRLAAGVKGLARSIKRRRDKEPLLAELAAAIAKAGDLGRAADLVRATTDPNAKARAFAELDARRRRGREV